MFVDVSIARRLEAAEARNGKECAESSANLHPAAGGISIPLMGGQAAYAGVGSPLTHALGLGMHGPVSDQELDTLEDFYRSRGSAPNIDLCPMADPSLIELLGRRGYRIFEFNNVLVRPVNSAGGASNHAGVHQVRPDEAREWASVMAGSFFEGMEITPEALDVGLVIFHMSSGMSFRVLSGGASAGGGAMAIHDGLATFFADGTLPSERGKGLQMALIRARLDLAAAHGCDLATAATVPGSISQRNYERCGFQVVYTKVGLTWDLDKL